MVKRPRNDDSYYCVALASYRYM